MFKSAYIHCLYGIIFIPCLFLFKGIYSFRKQCFEKKVGKDSFFLCGIVSFVKFLAEAFAEALPEKPSLFSRNFEISGVLFKNQDFYLRTSIVDVWFMCPKYSSP